MYTGKQSSLYTEFDSACYCSDAWAMSQVEEHKINAFERRAIRRVLRPVKVDTDGEWDTTVRCTYILPEAAIHIEFRKLQGQAM